MRRLELTYPSALVLYFSSIHVGPSTHLRKLFPVVNPFAHISFIFLLGPKFE